MRALGLGDALHGRRRGRRRTIPSSDATGIALSVRAGGGLSAARDLSIGRRAARPPTGPDTVSGPVFVSVSRGHHVGRIERSGAVARARGAARSGRAHRCTACCNRSAGDGRRPAGDRVGRRGRCRRGGGRSRPAPRVGPSPAEEKVGMGRSMSRLPRRPPSALPVAAGIAIDRPDVRRQAAGAVALDDGPLGARQPQSRKSLSLQRKTPKVP